MFKVTRKNKLVILTPAWDKTSDRRIVFTGFKVDDSDENQFYVTMLNASCSFAQEWVNNENGRGEYVDVKEMTQPTFLRFQKKEIVYKGDNPKTIKPSKYDLFLVEEFKSLAEQYPDGKIKVILDITEKNLGMIDRYQEETDPIKKAPLKSIFMGIERVEAVEDLDLLASVTAPSKGSWSRSSQEATIEILRTKYDFVCSRMSETLGHETPISLYQCLLEIEDIDNDLSKSMMLRYLDFLIALVGGKR